VSHTLSDLLARAAEAFERYEEVEVLQRLLNAWRQWREPRVAALVERLSERLAGHLTPVWDGPGAPLMWRHHPLDLPRLLPRMRELAERGFWSAVPYYLGALGYWPADPRFTPALLDLARRSEAGGRKDVFEALRKAFMASADPRALEPLRALRARFPPGSPQDVELDTAIQAIAALEPPPLDAETAARCEALEQALSAREAAETQESPTRAALLERVYADPRDVSARLVLADHLLEQGVPRGEFIVLQCTPRADRARVERLLEAHAERWAAPLGPHVAPGFTRFERGFPSAVRLRRDWREPLPEPGPAWRTVREVDLCGALFPDVAEWLSHPNLGGVTVWKRVAPGLLARELVRRGLGVRWLGMAGTVSPVAPELFPELRQLPELRRLFIRHASPEDVHLCVASGLGARLERFEARGTDPWALVVEPAARWPLRATLVREAGVEPLARVLRAAVGLGLGAVRVQGARRASREGGQLLRAAVSSYARVEWG
jgi:uncharacterized protein (TIGR02996 family)